MALWKKTKTIIVIATGLMVLWQFLTTLNLVLPIASLKPALYAHAITFLQEQQRAQGIQNLDVPPPQHIDFTQLQHPDLITETSIDVKTLHTSEEKVKKPLEAKLLKPKAGKTYKHRPSEQPKATNIESVIRKEVETVQSSKKKRSKSKRKQISAGAIQKVDLDYVPSKTIANKDLQGMATPGILSAMDGRIYIYSAIAYNSTEFSAWNKITLNGWEHETLTLNITKYRCCLWYDTSSKRGPVVERLEDKRDWLFLGKARLQAKQYVCLRNVNEGGVIPLAITLTSSQKRCPAEVEHYQTVVFPKKIKSRKSDQISVCAKIVYGNVSATNMMAWFEYQRYIGVAKVMTYTNNLNNDAQRVLQYYKETGFVDYIPFVLPATDKYRRSVGVKNFQSWNDEQVTVLDCQIRLAGFDYIALHDMDEYIYAKNDTDLKSLLKHLRKHSPHAAGFTFKTELFATTWGESEGSKYTIDIGKYVRRTMDMKDRVKSVVITSRLAPGRLSTHGYWPLKHHRYKKSIVPPDIATLRHYRTCRKQWMRRKGEKCFKTIKKLEDSSMLPIAGLIQEQVDKITKFLNINT